MTLKAKRLSAVICFVLAAGALAYWAATSRQMWTTTATPVVETLHDDIFNTDTSHTTWKDELRIGFEYAGATAGGLAVLGGLLLWSARRQARRASTPAVGAA